MERKEKLKLAVINNDIETVREIIEGGTDINTVFEYGITALHLATLNNSLLDLAAFIIDSGADMELKNKTGATVLISAARNNAYRIVDMLLNRGADIDARDDQNKTAFDHACHHGYEQTIKILTEFKTELDNLKGDE